MCCEGKGGGDGVGLGMFGGSEGLSGAVGSGLFRGSDVVGEGLGGLGAYGLGEAFDGLGTGCGFGEGWRGFGTPGFGDGPIGVEGGGSNVGGDEKKGVPSGKKTWAQQREKRVVSYVLDMITTKPVWALASRITDCDRVA